MKKILLAVALMVGASFAGLVLSSCSNSTGKATDTDSTAVDSVRVDSVYAVDSTVVDTVVAD